MRRPLYVILIAMCMLPALQAVTPPMTAENITIEISWFAGGKKSSLVDFPSAGIDESTAISIQTGLSIDDASMDISTVPQSPGSKSYPKNLTVDFGGDGVPEWQWKGRGWGDWGRQDRFISGTDNSTLVFGMDASNTTYFYMPKDAEVLGANCTINGSSTSALVIPAGGGGGSTNVFPFGSGTSVRFQWLYLPGEINTGGMLAKAGWKVQAGYGIGGSATLSNFKFKVCNTTITGLTTTFDSNYGGATPVTVIDAASYQISESNGYVWIDPPETFYYDNSKSLLMEVSFNNRVGTSFGLNVGTIPGESGSRRMWNMGDYQASTGSIDGNAYRYECSLEFVSKLDMSVDLLNDSTIDFQTQDKDWPGVNLEFGQELDGYLDTAEVNFTDVYGNDFVAVPLRIHMLYSGKMVFSGLSVTYAYTATIKNIFNVGGLADVLDELQDPRQGTGNHTIPIALMSESAGQVRLSNIYLKMHPPAHAPTINSFYPAAVTVVKENSELEFGIDFVDWYGNPTSIKWFFDGEEQPGATGTTITR
ncbi:MAG: hypothetical protein FJ149_08695, partial [Euryarchaeota archaeon]|nr:hypothetical protein [Euryarchaeota archaeon]